MLVIPIQDESHSHASALRRRDPRKGVSIDIWYWGERVVYVTRVSSYMKAWYETLDYEKCLDDSE